MDKNKYGFFFQNKIIIIENNKNKQVYS